MEASVPCFRNSTDLPAYAPLSSRVEQYTFSIHLTHLPAPFGLSSTASRLVLRLTSPTPDLLCFLSPPHLLLLLLQLHGWISLKPQLHIPISSGTTLCDPHPPSLRYIPASEAFKEMISKDFSCSTPPSRPPDLPSRRLWKVLSNLIRLPLLLLHSVPH